MLNYVFNFSIIFVDLLEVACLNFGWASDNKLLFGGMITFLITTHNVTVGRKWLWHCLLYIFVHVGQGFFNELWHQVWYIGFKFFRESIKNGSQLSFGCGCCAAIVCIHAGITEPHHVWFHSKPDHFQVRESNTKSVDPFPAGGTPNGRGVIIFDHLLTVSTFESRLGVKPSRSQERSHCSMKPRDVSFYPVGNTLTKVTICCLWSQWWTLRIWFCSKNVEVFLAGSSNRYPKKTPRWKSLHYHQNDRELDVVT